MTRVLVVDEQPAFLGRMRASLANDAAIDVDEVHSVVDAETSAAVTSPDVIVLGPSVPYHACLALADRLAASESAARVVVVSQSATLEVVREAMRHGVHDLVPLDGAFSEGEAAVRDAAAAAGARAEAPGKQAPPRGLVVTVFSTKGGVGKSVIACNVGVSLAKSGLRTVLVDLDLMFGDAAIMLDLTPERTIYDASQSFDRLDAEMLCGYLTKHASGLETLLSPVRPEDAEAVTASRAGTMLDMLALVADVVIVDTAAAFDDVVLAAIDRSDEVLAVATMDVASIKNTRVSLQKLGQLGYGDGLATLVLNRADSKVWLDAGEVEKNLPAPVVARIPSDRLVPRSVNRGAPVVLDAPRSGVARALAGLAEHVAQRARDRS
jgi:pilus assembly protein CpaE